MTDEPSRSFEQELVEFDPSAAMEALLRPARFSYEHELWAVALTAWLIFPEEDPPLSVISSVVMQTAEVLSRAENRVRRKAEPGLKLEAVIELMKNSRYSDLYRHAYSGLEPFLDIPSRWTLRKQIFHHVAEEVLAVYLIGAFMHASKSSGENLPLTTIIGTRYLDLETGGLYSKYFPRAKTRQRSSLWKIWQNYKLKAPFIYAAWSPLTEPHILPRPLPHKRSVNRLTDLLGPEEPKQVRPLFLLVPRYQCKFRPMPGVIKRVLNRARFAQEEIFSSMAASDKVKIPEYFKPEPIPTPILPPSPGSSSAL